jgi:tetratricopeptide (TPR) repeat protein/predicted Ser/Thr protein kinase
MDATMPTREPDPRGVTAEGSEVIARGEEPSTLDAPAAIAEALPRGATLGRYIVIELLGRGGMGVVYAAYDPALDRRIALKLVRPDSRREVDQTRLLREAQSLARVRHPAVVAVHDVGMLGGEIFVAMEFIEGTTLRTWLAEERRSPREVVDMFVRAGRGLAAAHAVGVVHRDFKPDNVIVDQGGQPRVVDFGLAREASPDPRHEQEGSSGLARHALDMTGTGHHVGTPAYMAPEQWESSAVDPRVDQFAFCVALHEGLYGARPFVGETTGELVAKIREGLGDPPKGSAVPARLRAVLARGLKANPAERYPSMDALLAELTRDHARTRRRALVAVGVAAALGIAAAASLRTTRSQVCTGAEARLAGVWDGDRRAQVQKAFEATGKPYAKVAATGVVSALDAYAQEWTAMETDACAATRIRGEQSEDLLDLRMTCLEGRRQDLRALVDLFAQADERVVVRARRAVDELRPLRECADAAALKAPIRAPSDPAVRAKVESVRAGVAEARALREGGRYKDAIPRDEKLAADARATDYGPLVAEAMFELGYAYGANGEAKKAEQHLQSAVYAAIAAHDDVLAAKTWIRLVYEVGVNQTRYAEAYRLADYGMATIERLGSGTELIRAELANSTGVVYMTEGKFEESRARHDESARLFESARATENSRYAQAVMNRGIALMRLGRHDEARADFERALAIDERVLGPGHPYIIQVLSNLSTDYALRNQPEKSLEYDERVLALAEAAYDPMNVNVGLNVGALCSTHLQLKMYDKALAECSRGLAIYEKNLGPDHLRVAFPLGGMGRAYLGLGQPDRAVPLLERALAIRHAVKGDPIDLAEVNFSMARALVASGGDKKRARALAEEARAAYAAGGEDSRRDLAEVEAWLARP